MNGLRGIPEKIAITKLSRSIFSLHEITMHEKHRIRIDTFVNVLMFMWRSLYPTIIRKQQNSLHSDAVTDPYLPIGAFP